jgi:hypothetical protein
MSKTLHALLAALVALTIVLSGTVATSSPAGAAAKKTCVKAPELRKVKVGMTLTRAKKILAHKKVNWGPAKDSYSQSFPVQCNSTRAMLIHASKGKVTAIVNEAENPRKTCTTFARFDKIKKGMTKKAASKVLKGKRFDAKDSTWWMPQPCQSWGMMQIYFSGKGKVTEAYGGFYYG